MGGSIESPPLTFPANLDGPTNYVRNDAFTPPETHMPVPLNPTSGITTGIANTPSSKVSVTHSTVKKKDGEKDDRPYKCKVSFQLSLGARV